jgi:glycosyltransferase involved in cell wall biosynthesis
LKRILHVVGRLDRGGAETWLVQVLRHIDREKYQMDFLVHTTDAGAYDAEVLSLGARIIPCLAYTNPMRYAQNFLRILRHYGPYDVVHSHVHHFSGYVMLLAAMGGVPTRISHGHTARLMRESARTRWRKTYDATMRYLVARFASAGIAVSQDSADAFFPPDWRNNAKWSVLYTGIDLSPFGQPVNRDEIRKGLGIPLHAVVVGHVGRFVPEKNHLFFVEIAREFAQIDERAFFLLVGDGDLRPAVEAQVQSFGLQGRFKFTGVRNDIPRLMMGAMDILLLPSRFEGIPLTLLEGQASGLPCLISDVVTTECDLVSGLIERESLTVSAQAWAKRLSRMSRPLETGDRKLTLPEMCSRSIQESGSDLLEWYNAR